MDLSSFAESVGVADPVSIVGMSTRAPATNRARTVRAPAGIAELLPDEMTVRCGAGTPVDVLSAALEEAGQYVALPTGGTVGGALACGQSDVRRLGRGPVRDAVLQVRYVGAHGRVVKAGGATVKNVSGFDLCRLMVGSRGTLGFLGEVILRTRPLPATSRWFRSDEADPFRVLSSLYRPVSVLWNGAVTWVCLEGHGVDVDAQSRRIPGAQEVDGPPPLPSGSRRSVPPTSLRSLSGTFVAEVGVGIVHHGDPAIAVALPTEVVRLNREIKERFDPSGRLNPGVDVLAPAGAP